MKTTISDFLNGRGRSFSHAFDGLASLWENEINIRIHCFFVVLAILAGIILQISASEWIAITIVIGFVLSAETLNSAIERNVDLCTKETAPLAKQAKDLAAGAVLIAAFTSVIVGLIIFMPKLISFF